MRISSSRSIFLFALLVWSTHGPAQGYYFGLRAGVPVTTYSPSSTAWQAGLELKGSLTYDINKSLWAAVELGYSVNSRAATVDSLLSTQMRNGFLETSWLLGRSFPIQKHNDHVLSWYFAAGPRLGLWVSGHGRWSGLQTLAEGKVMFSEIDRSKSEPDIIYISEPNRWQIGADAAVGVIAPWRPLRFFQFEIRYTHGFSSLGEMAEMQITQTSDPLDTRPRTITLSVAYRLTHHIKLAKKGNSTKGDRKDKKPRKNFDSMIR
ncbi:MAG: outer membrane beta-barrel protein [Cyclobacteriaceae bacterium]